MKNLTSRRVSLASFVFVGVFILYGCFFYFSQQNLLKEITATRVASVQRYFAQKEKEEISHLKARVDSIAGTIARLSAIQLENSQAFNLRKEGIEATLDPFMDYSEIAAIEVTDKAGRPYAAMWRDGNKRQFRASYALPPVRRERYSHSVQRASITSGENQGTIIIYIDNQSISQAALKINEELQQSANAEVAMLRNHFNSTLFPQFLVLLLGSAFILFSGRLIGRSYALIQRQRHELELFNWQLEKRVEERTGQLEEQFGKISALNKIMETEIAERKKMASELASERDLLRMLLENSPDHIFFKDLDSRFLKGSNALAMRFKLSHADELIGKNDFDFYADDHARVAYADEQQIIRTGQPIIGKIERETHREDESITWALTTKVPLRDTSGTIIGTFGIAKDITKIKEAESELQRVHKQLLETSRHAGMAEVATSVLHNVGNVLNSVNVSCSVVSEKVRRSRISGLHKTAELLREHESDLGTFFTSDPTAHKLPAFLGKLSEKLIEEQASILGELSLLTQNMQQSYAMVAGVREKLAIADLIEDALRMNLVALEKAQIELVRQFNVLPSISIDKHKTLQILINLVRNAQHSLAASQRPNKRLVVRIDRHDNGPVLISVSDNGIGIAPENLTRIFAHGFTTKKDGHGFGLHSGVLAAKEMGGNLSVASDGTGTGATFTLELPS